MKKVNKIGSKTKELWKNPEFRKKMLEARKNSQVTHGFSFSGKRHKLYMVFESMLQRCNNPKNAAYHHYGGRGIKAEWASFEEFRDDMFESYKKHKAVNSSTTLDRINNDGNYSKENCRWATRQEQSQNTRVSTKLTFNGKTQSLSEWFVEKGLTKTVLYNRLRRGWSVERALNTPIRYVTPYTKKPYSLL